MEKIKYITIIFLLIFCAIYYHKYTSVTADFKQYKTEQELAQAKADKAALAKSAVLAAKMNSLNEDLQNALSDNSSLNTKLGSMRESNATYKAKLNVLLNPTASGSTEGEGKTGLLKEFVRRRIPDAERADGYAIRLNDMLDRYAVLEKYVGVCVN